MTLHDEMTLEDSKLLNLISFKGQLLYLMKELQIVKFVRNMALNIE